MSALLSTPTPVPEVLKRRHGLLEGPRFDGDDLLYSDVTMGGVWRVCGADVEPVVLRRRGIGGIALHATGGVVIGGRALIHQHESGEVVDLARAEDGITGFNDLHVLPGGDVVAGALRFQPMLGETPSPGLLIRVGADGRRRVLDDSVHWPNGIGHSPAGDRLYVADYAQRQVMATALDGSSRELFCRMPRGSADGLAVDVDGGVWVALAEGAGIARFTAAGDLDDVFEVPAAFVTSLSFGGPDGRDVLITTADNSITPQTGGTLWRARSAVAGVPVVRATV